MPIGPNPLIPVFVVLVILALGAIYYWKSRR